MEWFRHQRKRWRQAKVKPGDGTHLKPFRWWQPLSRSLFSAAIRDHDGTPHTYAVDVHFFGTNDWGDTVAQLYRDGEQTSVSTLPAAFPVPGGRIEVEATIFGLKRMHLVQDDAGYPWQENPGADCMLTPHPRTAEGLRAQFAARHPVASAVVGGVAIVILLTSLVIAVPALIELVTQWELLADYVEPFTSPFDLPPWVSATLLVAGILAGIERALTLRNHWLIDADTTWLS